jgi:DNA-binding MarR family transcriptional regulator
VADHEVGCAPDDGLDDGLDDAAYGRLLAFRTELRRFEAWSRAQAAELGVTAAQHQLLLAVRGLDDLEGPTIGRLADVLLVRHHSVVELVDRAVGLGLVARHGDRDDHRVVRVRLTATGAEIVRRLSAVHLAELERLAPLIAGLPRADSP